MSLPKLKPWHWALIVLGLVLAAGALLASRTELLGSFLNGDVAKNVRSEYAMRKSGVRLVSAPPQAPMGTSSASPTPTPSPTELQTLAASKGSLTIASATPTPAKAGDETLDLTKPSDQLAPGGNQPHQGQRKELSDIPGRPRSSANFTAPAKGNNDAALVVGSSDPSSPPVPDSLLNQGYPGTSGNSPNGAVPTAATVIDPRRYLFNNLSPDAVAGNSVVLSTDNDKDYSLAGFAPKSSVIKLAMLQAVSSADMELDVKAAVCEPFVFQGRQLLEIGDQLLGTSSSSNKRDRILVTWHTILYKNGMSTAIDAVAQDPSGQIGIPGVQIGSRILQSITPVLLDTAAAFVQAFRQNAYTTIIPNNVSVGTVTVTNNQSAEAQLTDAGLSSVQGGLDKISELIAEDVESNKPYIFVMPGVKCQAYLRAPLDVTKRDYGN